MLKLRELETFYWTVRLGTFSAAAERLNATQSTISMRIQQLEQRFGIPLFDRSHRTARLTPKGKELMTYVERLLELTTEIQEQMSAPESVAGLVRVGVAEVVSMTWFPQFVKAAHHRYPKIGLEFEVALTMDLLDKLRNGTLDIVLVPGHQVSPNFLVYPLGAVEFQWMASPSLDIPRKRLTPYELQNWPVIALSKESYHHEAIEAWFRVNHAVCKRIDTCNSMEAVASLTRAGVGVSLLPPRCYEVDIREKRLRIVDVSPNLEKREFFAIVPMDEFRPITQRVAQLAVESSDFDSKSDRITDTRVAPKAEPINPRVASPRNT
jgi:DNA-binding transcriptional LysR family regulator